MELMATPDSTMPSAETCLSRDSPRITAAHRNGADERPQGNGNAAGEIQGDDGKGSAEGSALGNAQGGGGCQRVMENGLEDAARQTQPGTGDNGGANAGQAIVADDQIHLFVGGFPEDALDKLRRWGIIGACTQGKQNGHQQQSSQEHQKEDAPDLIFPVVC